MTGTLRFVFAFGCVTFALASWAAAGCGGDDEASLGHFAEACGSCADGLQCINGICTAACTPATTAMVCEPLAGGRPHVCSGGYCYLSCMSQFNCPNDLRCTMSLETQGTCRVQ